MAGRTVVLFNCLGVGRAASVCAIEGLGECPIEVPDKIPQAIGERFTVLLVKLRLVFEWLNRTITSKRPSVLRPSGTFTDDTQMSIAVAEALLTAGNASLDQLMTEMGRRFVEWSRSEKNNRAPGGTCMEGCANLSRGVPWRDAGVAQSKGCGAAMRVGPIGLYYTRLDQVEEVARASSLLTHGHPAALDSAAAGALMVAMALSGADPARIYDEIERRCCQSSPDFATVWRKVPELVGNLPEEVLVEGGLGEGWVAEEAVASAMYCFWCSPDDFTRAILTAINTDGDSDSIGAITGSMIGARLGIEAIPAKWRQGVEDSEYLHVLAKRVWTNRCAL